MKNLKIFFPTFIFQLFSLFCFSQRTDVLLLRNGNRITGEIKKLEYGLLTYKTDNIGTLSVKWRDVMKLWSKQAFELTTRNRETYFGTLDTTYNTNEIILALYYDSIKINMESLVKVIQLRNSFFARVDGTINAGFNYTKSSKVSKLSLNGNAAYTTFHDRLTLKGSTELTVQQLNDTTSEVTEKENLDLVYYRYFIHRWFASGFSGFEKNTGLGLNSRVQLGFGGGKELFQNNLHAINLAAGLVGNRENSIENVSTTNFEVVQILQYRIYKYSIPKVILSTSFSTFESLSEKGRFRYNADMKVDFEFYKDFIFSITYYYDFDNKPASAAADTFDWGITSSIGYTF